MSNEKANFAIQTTKEERDRAMEVLAKQEGNTNGEKFISLINKVESVLALEGMSKDYIRYAKSIKYSVDNIEKNVIAIYSAAAEERKHDATELQEKVETHLKTIKNMQHEQEAYVNRLKMAEEAKEQAETEAEKANVAAKQLMEEKAFYESAARDKESLVALLQEKVANLQSQLDSAEAKIVELNTMLAKMPIEQTESLDYDFCGESNVEAS